MTDAQRKVLSGKGWPCTRTAREMLFRALVDRQWIDPMTGKAVAKARAALEQTKGESA